MSGKGCYCNSVYKKVMPETYISAYFPYYVGLSDPISIPNVANPLSPIRPVTITIRREEDPAVLLSEITKGTGYMGDTQTEKAKLGVACLFFGSAILLFTCFACGCFTRKHVTQSNEAKADPSKNDKEPAGDGKREAAAAESSDTESGQSSAASSNSSDGKTKNSSEERARARPKDLSINHFFLRYACAISAQPSKKLLPAVLSLGKGWKASPGDLGSGLPNWSTLKASWAKDL